MNKRDEAILARAREHHPELLHRMKTILSMGGGMGGFDLLLEIAFEAGRKFERENSGIEPDDPSVYVEVPATQSA